MHDNNVKNNNFALDGVLSTVTYNLIFNLRKKKKKRTVLSLTRWREEVQK